MRLRVLSLALLRGLRIWHCHEPWCSSKMWLGSHADVPVVQAGSYSSNSTPSLGTSICRGSGPRNNNNNNNNNKKDKRQQKKNNNKIIIFCAQQKFVKVLIVLGAFSTLKISLIIHAFQIFICTLIHSTCLIKWLLCPRLAAECLRKNGEQGRCVLQ